MSGSSFVNLDNARFDDQRKVMEAIDVAGHCPFCPEQLALYHKKPILKEGEYWVVTENQWPYRSTKHHYLLISKAHTERLADLTTEAGREFWELCRYLEEHFGVASGGVAMRFGSEMANGSTVRHLHAHFIVPDRHFSLENPVRFKIG